jgi:hypothetical protein
MASVKERAKWERWFDAVTERMERQKQSLTRVVLLFTEAMAALEEIAADDPDGEIPASDYRERAQKALQKIKAPAAAAAVEGAESITAEEPVEDPRRSK